MQTSRISIDARIARLFESVNAVVRGKPEVVRRSVITLLAGGHLLIEDVPGVGKTTLARALAVAMGGTFRRVQFTSDLMPADILGVNVFDPASKRLPLPAGAGLLSRPAGRRDQSHHARARRVRCCRRWKSTTSPWTGRTTSCPIRSW